MNDRAGFYLEYSSMRLLLLQIAGTSINRLVNQSINILLFDVIFLSQLSTRNWDLQRRP